MEELLHYPQRIDAIRELVGGSVSGFLDGSEVTYHDGQTAPTTEEIDAEIVKLETEYDAQEYARDRATEYPTWQEQMDMQYHDQLNGTTTWKDAVAKVKSDNPKE